MRTQFVSVVTLKEMFGVMAYAYDRPEEAQTGRSLGLAGQPSNGDPKTRQRLCLNKNKMEGS